MSTRHLQTPGMHYTPSYNTLVLNDTIIFNILITYLSVGEVIQTKQLQWNIVKVYHCDI